MVFYNCSLAKNHIDVGHDTFQSSGGEGWLKMAPPERQPGVALLLFPAIFAGLVAGVVFAQDAGSRLPSSTSSNSAVKSNRAENAVHPAVSSESEEKGLTQEANEITRLFGLPITNSMVVTWITALGLIVLARIATRHIKPVPSGIQNLWEWLVEGLYTFLEGIIGPHLVKRTFWFFASIFIFILAANWISLVPGVGTLGWGHHDAKGFKIDQPLFRGANADLNLTLGMALVFFACWIVWSIREQGPLGILNELFAPKGESTGLMRVIMVVVFFAAGCIEIISILFRPISLSFRLYGNVFAGENMLETMTKLVPGLGWLLPIPFYFLELVVGLVQAMVFMLLTAVFTLLMCQHEEEKSAAVHA
jgi:F-type H+-transporting ATPase subunit a